MKKRLFLIMTALLLLFPSFSAFALNPCEHYPGQVADHELEEVNKVPPQEGVAGSVDLRCPICHKIVDRTILPALPMSAEHPAASDAENQPDAASVSQTEPEPVIQPEQSVALDAENPPDAASVSQTEQEPVIQSEQPAVSGVKNSPDAASASQSKPEPVTQPEKPAQSETSALQKIMELETSVQLGNQAEQIDETETVTWTQESGTAQTILTSEPPKAQDVIANVLPQTGGSAEGGGTTGSSARNGALKNTSTQAAANSQNSSKVRIYPYRRIKMKPQPGIRAKAPGDLIWPLYGTPFQDLFSD